MALSGPYAPDSLTPRDNWRTRAECAPWNATLFHPEHTGTGPYFAQEAKSLCARCQVQPQCLAFALDTREPFGVWGGLDERERQQLLGGPARTVVADVATPPTPEPVPVQ